MPTDPPEQPKRGLTYPSALKFLLVVCLAILAVLSFAFVKTQTRTALLAREVQEMKNENTRRDLERDRVKKEEELTLAKNQQAAALRHLGEATNVLTDLLNSSARVRADLASLRTNEAGRTVALHSDLVALARRLYETDSKSLPPPQEIAQRLEAVRRVQKQVLDESGKPFVPNESLTSEAIRAQLWAESQQNRVSEVDKLRDALVQESQVKVLLEQSTNSPPNLETAIQKFVQAELAEKQLLVVMRRAEAAKEGNQEIAEQEGRNLRAEKKLQAENLREQERALTAQAERKKQISEVVDQSAKDRTQNEVVRLQSDARREALRAKASRADIQQDLSAFLQRGHYKPFRGNDPIQSRIYLEAQPISLNDLKRVGALAPDLEGLRRFVAIGSNRGNDRPELSSLLQRSGGFWWKDDKKLEEARRLQGLLIELGPTFVELGLMPP